MLRNIGATQNIVDTWEEQTLEKYAYETKDTSIYTMETPFMELRDHWSDFPGRLKQTVQDYRAEGQIVRDKYRTEIATLVSDVNKLMDQISESDTEDASSVMGQLTTLQTSLTVLLTRL